MPGKTIKEERSTEEKIKEAASQVFTQKGYAATRTRDIAAAAGINLALLNYYFRSKEKLFLQIMMEKVEKLFGVIAPVVSDSSTLLDTKIELIVKKYIDMLTEHPDLPMFVLSELRNNPEIFAARIHLKELIQDSSLIKQLTEKKPDINPLHFLMSILGMTVFPFIAQPVFSLVTASKDKGFNSLMQERKKLIPIWIKAMLE